MRRLSGYGTATRAAAQPAGGTRHRLWPTAIGLALGPAVALGFARFAYALLLPGMRADLSWSFAQAGTMNTANAVGYLVGALLATPLSHRTGARAAFAGSLLLTALALLASAASGAFAVLLALRLLAGAAGAVVFIVGATLAAGLASGGSNGRTASVLGVYFAGGGLGVAVSGLLIPVLRPGRAPAGGAGGGSVSARWLWPERWLRCRPPAERRFPPATRAGRPAPGGRVRSRSPWAPTPCSAPATSPT